MMRRVVLVLFWITILGALVVPSPVVASGLEGTFLLNGGKGDDIRLAIEKSVAAMNIVIRPLAREQLRKNNDPPARITLEFTPNEVIIATDRDVPLRTPSQGTPVRLEDEEQSSVMVSTRMVDDVLVQTFKARDGQRINVYSSSSDGKTLTMDVTVSSPHLKIPVTYRLYYQRI